MAHGWYAALCDVQKYAPLLHCDVGINDDRLIPVQHHLLWSHVTQFGSREPHTAVNETAFYFGKFRETPQGTIRAVIRDTYLFDALNGYVHGDSRSGN